MKNIIKILLIILLSANTAFGYINIPNANGTELFVYQQSIPSAIQYVLHSTDSLQLFSIDNYIGISSYPKNVNYTFSSSSANINTRTEYSIVEGLIYDDIYAHTHVYVNTIDKGNFTTRLAESHIRYLIQDYDALNFKVGIYGTKLTVVSVGGFFNTQEVNFVIILDNPVYITSVLIPTVTSVTDLHFENIYIRYLESSYSITLNSISESVDSLNPLLRFVYYIFNSVIYVFNKLSYWTGGLIGISDYEAIEYKKLILQPLSLLSYVIDTIISTVVFIFTMGLLLTLSLIIMVIFIYSYIVSKDIFEAFTLFGNFTKTFISTVIITPTIWIYDGFLKLISIIRGGG